MSRTLRFFLAAVVMASALGIYVHGAFHSELLDPHMARQKAFLRNYLRNQPPDLDVERERALADAYWSTYPSVGNDPYYGRIGQMGIHGARAHYERHGKRSGWVWPTLPPSPK